LAIETVALPTSEAAREAAPATQNASLAERRTAQTLTSAESTPAAATRRRGASIRRALAAADVVAVLLAVLVAAGTLRPAALGVALLLVAGAKMMGLYDRDVAVLQKRTIAEVPALFQLATLFALLTWLGQSVVVGDTFDQRHVVALWLLLAGNLILTRTAARRLVRGRSPVERCLVVGDADAHDRLVEKLHPDPRLRSRVVAQLPLVERRAESDVPPHRALERCVFDHNVQRVIVAPDGVDAGVVLDVVSRAQALGVNVSVLPRICEVIGSAVEFDDLNGMTLLGVKPLGLSRSSRVVKRSVDVVGAACALVLTAPLLALCALAIRLDSRGPALFRQTRVGRDGEHFEIIKFRSMVDGAHEGRADLEEQSNGNGLFKVPDDPRVTRIGRILRRTSLDELPQLINVLRGEMSLVGPRPLILEEDRLVAGHHRRRLHLKPGLTGPWQVLGSPRARVGLQDMATIDYLYVANWSLWTDLQVILRTIVHVLGARGV
jgi:exopolysaccharide biosynthesis polyprenyl glycosylphosphotransferase